MAEITAAAVKELREKTGAGMMDCKKALSEAAGDIEKDVAQCVDARKLIEEAMVSLSDISEENAASSEETGASMQELSATVTTLASSANNLKEIADKLSSDMEFFKD